ncbi:MAG: hypothetical protein M1821_001922 [Bathelium mastoideum]|nr:MAG: hypothetical protein M1821_001922 [Bathelium mastoideum]
MAPIDRRRCPGGSDIATIDIRRFPHPRLSRRAKQLRDRCRGPKIPVVVGNEEDHGEVKTFYVFKSLLSAHSPYFEATTSERWSKDSQQIRLYDDDPQIFELLLQWMCTGDFSYMEHCLRGKETCRALEQRERSLMDPHKRINLDEDGDLDKLCAPTKMSWCYYRIVRDDDMEYEDLKLSCREQALFFASRQDRFTQVVERTLRPNQAVAAQGEEAGWARLFRPDTSPELVEPFNTYEFWCPPHEELEQALTGLPHWIKRGYFDCTIGDAGQMLETLITFYFFADRIGISDLQDRIIEEILDQELLYDTEFDHIESIYRNTAPGSRLRALILERLHRYDRVEELGKPHAVSEALGEFFSDYAFRLEELKIAERDECKVVLFGNIIWLFNSNKSGKSGIHCEYHEHGDHDFCSSIDRISLHPYT